MANVLEGIRKNEQAILEQWLQGIKAGIARRDLMDDKEVAAQAGEVLAAICGAPVNTSTSNLDAGAWQVLKDLLASISASRAMQGFTPSETALFVLALKAPLYKQIRRDVGGDADELYTAISNANDFVDKLALHTMDSFIHGRDQVILRQQEEMLELSTPVVTLWEGILALPLIGTLDSARRRW